MKKIKIYVNYRYTNIINYPKMIIVLKQEINYNKDNRKENSYGRAKRNTKKG